MSIRLKISVFVVFGFVLGCISSHNSKSVVSTEIRENDNVYRIYNDLACACNGRIILGTWLGNNKDTLLSLAFDEESLTQKTKLLLGKLGNQSNLTLLASPGSYNPLCSEMFFTNVDTVLFLEIVEGSFEIESVVRGDSAVHMTGLLNATYRSRVSGDIRVKDVLINVNIGACGF